MQVGKKGKGVCFATDNSFFIAFFSLPENCPFFLPTPLISWWDPVWQHTLRRNGLERLIKLMMVVLLLPIGYYYHCDTWCSIPFFEENKIASKLYLLYCPSFLWRWMRNNIFITFCSMVQFSLLEIHIYHQEYPLQNSVILSRSLAIYHNITK